MEPKNKFTTAQDVVQALKQLSSPQKALASARFFKTKPTEYGAGDVFWGITVPEQRVIARQAEQIPLTEIQVLLSSPIHEQRITALLIITARFKKALENERRTLYRFYLRNSRNINNWDLVDTSAPTLMGEYLLAHPTEQKILTTYVTSHDLWKRRMAIICTLAFIRKNDFNQTILISSQLLNDKEDLIHKAVGWMLREAGKRDKTVLINFLKTHQGKIPRTALRYAIEHFSTPERKKFLQS